MLEAHPEATISHGHRATARLPKSGAAFAAEGANESLRTRIGGRTKMDEA